MQENAKLRREFEEALRKLGSVANHPPDDDREVAETLLDLTQMGLDIAGAIEPTPIADGVNAGISVLRGNWLDAGVSAAGFIPWLGDLAKLTRIAEYPGRLARAIKLALESDRFMKLLLPVLKKLRAALERIPTQRLPDRIRQPLENLKKQLDNFFQKADVSDEAKRSGRGPNDPSDAQANPSQQQQTRPRGWAQEPNEYWKSGKRVLESNSHDPKAKPTAIPITSIAPGEGIPRRLYRV
jgi:hypothetical protein